MMTIILSSILAAAAAGLLVKYILDHQSTPQEITWREFVIGMGIISVIVSPGVAKIGWEMVKSGTLIYNEYWNGWELAATKQEIQCTRDGPCSWEYDCDPYLCNPHDCNCVCVSHDENGNCTSESCSTCWDTCYHACPYVSTEYNFYVDSMLGSFTIAANMFPTDPQAHRWRRGVSVPAGVISRAGTGEPPFWVAARGRCLAGEPGPVTARREYDNYILASDRTILKQYSASVDKFSKAGILPPLQSGIRDFYFADKVHFVGFQPDDLSAWQSSLSYLNAKLGSELQGDVQLVVVQRHEISADPDTYALALKAHWLNKETMGRNALSKNGIGVIVGTDDGKMVAWARAFTGMPVGNEHLEVAVRSQLKGVALTSESLIGKIRGEFSGGGVRGVRSNGALESILWGLKDPKTKFRRYSMTDDDPNDVGGGYLYLIGEIQPTGGQKVLVAIFTFIAACLVWVAAAAIGERVRHRRF